MKDSPCGSATTESTKEQLLLELRSWQRHLALSSLDEAIRLIESEKVEKLTSKHLHSIAEYDAITIDGESFFHKAFSSGKAPAACLAFAMELGWRAALDDMVRLRTSVLGNGVEAATQVTLKTALEPLRVGRDESAGGSSSVSPPFDTPGIRVPRRL